MGDESGEEDVVVVGKVALGNPMWVVIDDEEFASHLVDPIEEKDELWLALNNVSCDVVVVVGSDGTFALSDIKSNRIFPPNERVSRKLLIALLLFSSSWEVVDDCMLW